MRPIVSELQRRQTHSYVSTYLSRCVAGHLAAALLRGTGSTNNFLPQKSLKHSCRLSVMRWTISSSQSAQRPVESFAKRMQPRGHFTNFRVKSDRKNGSLAVPDLPQETQPQYPALYRVLNILERRKQISQWLAPSSPLMARARS